MLREDGVVMDDGTTTRISENHYHMTTTTAQAANVLSHLDYYLDFMFKSDDLESKPDLPSEVWRESAPIGSNTFAISPSRTPEKDTFLLINAHQPWEGPIAWYEVHLNSEEGWNMMGGVFPGSPFIFVGFNENVGWGFTVNKPDLSDSFLLRVNPENDNEYWLDGKWSSFKKKNIKVV